MKITNPFYKSKAWLECRAFVLNRDAYLCQPCLQDEELKRANTVHHIKSLEEYPELALDPENLESICPSCHNKVHPEKGGGKKKEVLRKKRKAIITVSKANRERW